MKKMRIGAIVQARMSSTRLPGKILLNLPYNSEVTVLQQVIRRLKKARSINEVIIATTDNPADDQIVSVAERENCKWFRGSESDVLARYYGAAKNYNLDLVVRITSDCPSIDPGIVDDVIQRHMISGVDYTSNTREITFPRGQDTEVFSFHALEKTFQEANKPYEREHVTIFIYEHPELFQIANVIAKVEEKRPELRLTIDTLPDYALLCCIFDELYWSNPYFTLKDIIGLFDKKPWLIMINKEITQKSPKY